MIKRGFTLVELLAVIVIIAAISLLTTISVNSIILKSKSDLSETQIKNIEKRAEVYYIKEGMDNLTWCISVEDLIKKGYIESDLLKDFRTNERINGSVMITASNNRYTYTYTNTVCPTPVCELNDKNGSGEIDLLDEVTCGTGDERQTFYVITNDPSAHSTATDDNVTLLAKYNLNVGKDVASGFQGIQNSGATGLLNDNYASCNFTAAQFNNHMASGGNYSDFQNGERGCNGTLSFSLNTYGYYPNAFVYNEDSLLHQYVENYKIYMKDQLGVDVKEASLGSYSQIKEVLTLAKTRGNFNFTSFWLGTASGTNSVYCAESNGSVFQAENNIDLFYGARPVIIIPQHNIKLAGI